MHQVEGAPLLGVGHPHDVMQFGPAVLFPERPKEAAALDAGELFVVAGEDQLGAGCPRSSMTRATCLVDSIPASSTISTVRRSQRAVPRSRR